LTQQPAASVWLVLRHRTFRVLWIAALISMIGSWMQSLGAAWLMTELDRSPVMVGLVQAAQMLPGIALAPLAGALADMFDRRRFLMTVMAWQTGVTLLLAALTFGGLVTPWLLIACIFAVGIGSACQTPAMSANLQDIVPREDVIGAVTLNSIALNISRAVGPAIAGVLVGITGEGSAFLINSACYAAYLGTVARKIRSAKEWTGPAQSFWETMAGGIRYARRARRFRAVMIRGFCYFLFASSAMALLPVMARQELKIGPEGFGSLLGFIGVGAIVTGFGLVGRINARFARDRIVLATSLIVAACLVAIAWTRHYAAFCAILVVFGGAWMTTMISFQIAAQMVLPPWVRGRGLSLSMMSFSAGMAGGSIGWGAIATHASLTVTYAAAGIGLALTALATYRFKIGGTEPEEA
jgi:MFS family permease